MTSQKYKTQTVELRNANYKTAINYLLTDRNRWQNNAENAEKFRKPHVQPLDLIFPFPAFRLPNVPDVTRMSLGLNVRIACWNRMFELNVRIECSN